MQLFDCQEIDTKDEYKYAVTFNRKKNGASNFAKYTQIMGEAPDMWLRYDFSSRTWYATEKGYEYLDKEDARLFPRKEKTKTKRKPGPKSHDTMLCEAIADTQKVVTDYEHIGEHMKLKPYKYQQEVIKYCSDAENCLIVSPCGSGKTPMLCGVYDTLKQDGRITGKGMIVVKASLKVQWFHEIQKFTDYVPRIIKTPSQCKKGEWEEQFDDCDIYVLNYETLRNDKVRKELHKQDIEFVGCDEIHFVKDDTAKRSQALCEFNMVPYKIGATATPVQRDPRDLYGIYRFINPTLFPKKSAFESMYIRWGGFGLVLGSKNEKQLNKKISPYMILKTQEEVSKHLPDVIVSERHCQLEKAQQKLNDQLMQELDDLNKKLQKAMIGLNPKEVEMDPEVKKLTAAVNMIHTVLQELADSEELFDMSESDTIKKYKTKADASNKLELLVDTVDEIIESGQKVAIFSRFRKMQDIFTARFKQKNCPFKDADIAYVNGAIKDEDRYDEVEKFKNDENCKILLLSDAGAEGLNLSNCMYLIEYEPAQSYAIQTQRRGRNRRADSIHDTVYVIPLICDNSYDEIGQRIVAKKERYDTTIIHGEEIM